MATVHLYLDKRHLHGSEAQIKISINKRGSSSYIQTGQWVMPQQWENVREQVKNHPNKNDINRFILSRKMEVHSIIMRLTMDGKLSNIMATQIKNLILDVLEPKEFSINSFFHRMGLFCESRQAASTKEKYRITMKRILEYDKKARTRTFDDINRDWLDGFDRFLMKYNPAKNGRSIHLRNIRAVFNDAIDNEITTAYPFRKLVYWSK